MITASMCGDFGVIRGGVKACLLCLLDRFGQDADNVGPAGVELGHFVGVDVEAGDLKAFCAEEQSQRQPNIPHADDANAGIAVFPSSV